MKVNKSFNGITIYVGIDVHAKSWSIATFTENTVLKKFSLSPPNCLKLTEILKDKYPDANFRCCYEAGFSGFWIQRQMEDLGFNTVIVNAADIPISNKDLRRKTDSRDASKMARELRSGSLVPIFVPSVQSEKDRSILRYRHLLVRDERRVKQRIKMHLHFSGHTMDISQLTWSDKSLAFLKDLAEQQHDQYILTCIDQLQKLKAIKKDISKKIKVMSKSDRYITISYLLQSIPGISCLGSMILLTEMIDMKRFSNLDHLSSYVGLVPDTKSSGQTDRDRGITKRSNKRLRALIIEMSWIAIRYDNALSIAYSNYCKRMKGQKAIVKIARKLLSRIRYVWLNQQPYKYNMA